MALIGMSALGGSAALNQQMQNAYAQQSVGYNAPAQDKRKFEIILDQMRGLLDRIHMTNSTLGSLADRVMGSTPSAMGNAGPCPPHCCILDEIGGALESLNSATIYTAEHAKRLETLA